MDEMENRFLASYDTHADDLYRYIFFRVFSKERAEELLQETFLKTWEYVRKGKTIESPKAFLYRTAVNLIIDDSRKKKTISLEAVLENNPGLEPSADNRSALEAGLLMGQIKEKLAGLPEDQQQLITLRYMQGLEPKEMAEVLGITANNASVKLNRAVAALKEEFEE